jgi:hypothetical protein
MMEVAQVTVCSQINTKHREQSVQSLNVKLVGASRNR